MEYNTNTLFGHVFWEVKREWTGRHNFKYISITRNLELKKT